MREIDQVRITLLRMFRGAVRLPEEIINELLKPFLHTQDAAIKVQAYGRGLLQRFRYHRLITKDFNRQASREYQGWLKYRLPHTVLELQEAPIGFSEGVARFCINEDYDGISAKWYTREHRESKLKAYRKTMFMKNSIAKHRFPKQRSIQFHGLTDAEVIHLVENVLASLRASTEDELGRAGDELGRAEDELGRAGDE